MVFMNRSGSSMIGEYMRATGKFSGFGEPLNHELVLSRAKKHNSESFPDYFRWLMKEIRQEGTLFGLKASLEQVVMLFRANVIPTYFADVRWAVVRRRDILSQAISLTVAQQTQQWHSVENSNGREPQYDYHSIKENMDIISQAYSSTMTLLASLGIEPLHLVYEDFIADPIEQTRRFASHMGVDDVSIAPERLRLQQQRTDRTESFKEQFLQDFRSDVKSGCKYEEY